MYKFGISFQKFDLNSNVQIKSLKQNEMNNALTGGKIRKRKGKGKIKSRGGGLVEVQPIHAAYPNSGIQSLNTDLTQVQAQQQANAQYDNNVVKAGGSIRRKRSERKTIRRKTNKRRKTNRRNHRKSRRHR